MHEIKNALGNIYSLAEIMEKDPKESKSCMLLVKKVIMQIKNLEHDYNEYRKIGKVSVSKNTIYLASLINNIVSEYRIGTNVKIMVKCGLIRLETDATKLRQVISNLLSNAIKYNVLNGSILIDCTVVDKSVCICVKDTGIGMTNTEIALLGTEFYRCKKIDVPGTGLGWALIKSIVALMKWDIQIYSGSRSPFEFTTTIKLTLPM